MRLGKASAVAYADDWPQQRWPIVVGVVATAVMTAVLVWTLLETPDLIAGNLRRKGIGAFVPVAVVLAAGPLWTAVFLWVKWNWALNWHAFDPATSDIYADELVRQLGPPFRVGNRYGGFVMKNASTAGEPQVVAFFRIEVTWAS